MANKERLAFWHKQWFVIQWNWDTQAKPRLKLELILWGLFKNLVSVCNGKREVEYLSIFGERKYFYGAHWEYRWATKRGIMSVWWAALHIWYFLFNQHKFKQTAAEVLWGKEENGLHLNFASPRWSPQADLILKVME